MPALADRKKPLLSKKEMDLDEKAIILDNPLRLVYAGYLSIKTKDGRLIKLDLNSTQQKLFSKILELRKAGKPIRAWVLKYRQGGISTEVEAIIYALTSQQENINSLILADEKEHANNLFEMSKLYQEKLEAEEPHLAPKLKKSNEKKLEFEGIHSQIIIASAENKESAKSHTFHAVHLSEVAFFPDLRTVLADLNQTVPDLPGTMVIGETTANGMNEFYHQWVRAVEGKTDWLPLFFPWFEMSEYSMPLQDGKLYPLEGINFTAETSRATFEKEEQDLKFDNNLTDEQLNWRRYAIVNKCQGSLYTFKCQYPSTWREAFETSGAMFFDQKGMAKQKSKLPIAVGELFYTNLKWEFRDLPQGRIEIFERPGESEQYIVAGDASEAVDSDEAAILVLNKRTNTTAAIVVGQHPPEELAQLEISLGNYYNNAIIAQENKGYGYQVNQLVFANYGNVYRKIINKDGVDVQTDELGFNTNSVTRPQMLAQMAEEIKNNSTSLLSAKLIAECNSFVIKRDSNGNVTKIEAQDGVQDGKKLYQDGLVICRAIAGIVRNQFPYKILETKDTHARQRAAVQEHKRGMFGYE